MRSFRWLIRFSCILIVAQGAEKKLFGFSFLPLEDKHGATVADGLHNLLLYKVCDKVI